MRRLRQIAPWLGITDAERFADAQLWRLVRQRLDNLDPAWWPADPREAWSKLRSLLPDREPPCEP